VLRSCHFCSVWCVVLRCPELLPGMELLLASQKNTVHSQKIWKIVDPAFEKHLFPVNLAFQKIWKACMIVFEICFSLVTFDQETLLAPEWLPLCHFSFTRLMEKYVFLFASQLRRLEPDPRGSVGQGTRLRLHQYPVTGLDHGPRSSSIGIDR